MGVRDTDSGKYGVSEERPVQNADPLRPLFHCLRSQRVRNSLHVAHYCEASVAVLGMVVRLHDLAVLQLDGSDRRGFERFAVAAERPLRHVEISLLPGFGAEGRLANGALIEQESIGDAVELIFLGMRQRAGDFRLARIFRVAIFSIR